MSYKWILYDVDQFGICRITLNDPERINPVAFPMLAELDHALVAAEKDDSVKVIVLKGAGRGFSAGYDLNPEVFLAGEEPKGKKGEEWRGSLWNSRAHVQGHADYWFRIWDLWKIVISQVHGYCLAGGAEPVLASDIVTIAEDCVFGNPVNRWIDVGDVQALYSWHVGPKKAMDIQMGRLLTGKEACEWGLATYCFPADQLEEQTTKIAKRIAIMEPELLMLHKTLVHRTFDLMGFRTSCYYGAEYDSMGHARNRMRRNPYNEKWEKLVAELGLAKALKKTHEPFGGLKPGGLNEYPY